ncbi:hypothetical protein MVEN_01924100 [Mycena venus]|uniref:F-box domain-containing protein n=1 Tax=Mycena venus TaxID=2733690 RepID=A0A8H7CJQ3_9AGAR|nr:hypothetical protein MVEN_01924100 [Mycena venus]
MNLTDLGTDVLSHIFALVDVYTILSLARVNRYFHNIASTKQLWLSIVCELSARGFINTSVEEIDTLSKDALVEEVRRVVAGPQTWSPSSSLPPRIFRQINLESGCLQAELLGARFILLLRQPEDHSLWQRRIECFDLHSRRRVCTWTRPDFELYAVTLDSRGRVSDIVVVVTMRAQHSENWHLVFLRADLNTGQLHDLLHLPFPVSTWGLWDSQLCGNFFISSTGVQGRWILLLNWQSDTFVLLERNSDYEVYALLPGHVVSTHPVSDSTTHRVNIYPLTSFDHLWRSFNESSLDHPINPTAHLHKDIIHLQVPNNGVHPVAHQHRIGLSVLESPVHDDTYEIVIHLRDLISPPPLPPLVSLLSRKKGGPTRGRGTGRRARVTVSRFSVALPARQMSPPELTLKSVSRGWTDFTLLSGAGYGLYNVPGHVGLFVRRLVADGAEVPTPRRLRLRLPFPCSFRLTQSEAFVVYNNSHTTIMYYQ